jgi:two-component system chemotaxis response regulator CheB
MIDAVVIDDSAFMRKALQIMLESDPEIRVVAMARDGEEGFEKVKQYRPDIVTLDIEMPRTNGLECLDLIMSEVPTPVLVVSSITAEGAQITLEALDRGAVDYIQKTQSFVAIDITQIKESLIQKVKTIAKKSPLARLKAKSPAREYRLPHQISRGKPNNKKSAYRINSRDVRCVAIGVSTGGPPVVQTILGALPKNYPAPILVAQHMPKEFTKTFAERMDKNSQLTIKEAETGDVIKSGHAYIARGGKHLIVKRNGVHVIGELTDHPVDNLYHPSADVLFNSVSEVYGSAALGVILTGMGQDGLQGLRQIKQKGGTVLAQNEETCVVYGMPKAAVEAGVADAVLSVEQIVDTLGALAQT